MKKEETPIYCPNNLIFQLIGPSLKHFISKYFAKKRGNQLIRGKLSSLIKYILRWWPSWICYKHKKYELCTGQNKGHCRQVCLQTVQCFQKRIYMQNILFKSSALFCRTCVMHYYITTFASQRINICEGQHFIHTQILS